MKFFLTKFRISNALDTGKPMPESLRRKINAEPELQRFEQRMQALNRPLQGAPPADTELHDSIMSAVHASKREAGHALRACPTWQALTASCTVAAMAAVCLWIVHFQSTPSLPLPKPSLDTPLTVLEMSESMPATMPSMVTAPLSTELERVNNDVQTTKQILLASFP